MPRLYRFFTLLLTGMGSFCTAHLAAAEFVVGDLMGQLGNQLFIIATTASLALDHSVPALFPSLRMEKDYNIPINHEQVFSHLDASDPCASIDYVYIEPYFHYVPIKYRPRMMIRGWFQSEKYFKHNKEHIMQLFAAPSAIEMHLQERYAEVLSHSNTVAIHYRSYDKEDPHHEVYAACDVDYYQRAMSLFSKDTLFVIFSNDMAWCKKNFKNLSYQFYFVEGEPHYHDLYLMSMCHHNIICNSSFSWWGAYLNKNIDKVVIAPAAWFNPNYKSDTQDLLPPEWLVL
jgi:hypothetical protein